MIRNRLRKAALAGSALCAFIICHASAADLDIQPGDLSSALDTYVNQTGVHIFYAARDLKGVYTNGVSGDLPVDKALDRLLANTGFVSHRDGNIVEIVRDRRSVNVSEIFRSSSQQQLRHLLRSKP